MKSTYEEATITDLVQNISLGREKGLEKSFHNIKVLHLFVVSLLCAKYLSLKNLYKFIPEKWMLFWYFEM